MKHIFSAAAIAACLLSTASLGASAQNYVKSSIVEDGGTGQYKAIMIEEPSLPAHTVLRPGDLVSFGEGNLLPILVWGNGACNNSPWEHINFLSELASHGYLVLASGYIPLNGERYRGPMSTPEQQIESIDWAYRANEDETSPYYHKLDLKNIAIAGMSCGGLETLSNSAEPRIKTIMICNSGLFGDPSGAVPGMPMPPKEKLDEIKVPVMYLLGGPEDIAYANGMDDFSRLTKVPAFAANFPAGHAGTYAKPHGGEFSVVATAWLDWQLKGSAQAAELFNSELMGLEGWTGKKKNF